MRALIAAALALLCQSALAMSSFSPDASDLWWNPDESGWGANLIQQHNVILATLFVYGADGRARWYVSSELTTGGAPEDVEMIWSGRLYETTGPVVASGAFNASAVARRDVGTMRFFYRRPNNGTLEWTVDGVTTSKLVRRQTWTSVDITGEFYLNRVLRAHLCNGPNTGNEPSLNEAMVMNVARSGDAVQIATRPVAPGTLACTYTGSLSQEGRMSRVEGTYTCNDGSAGPFSLTEVEVSQWGFMARIFTNVRGCAMHGHFGGARVRVAERPS